MKNTILLVCMAAMMWLNYACVNKNAIAVSEVTAYHPKVNAFTSGTVSNQSAVRIVFAETVPSAVPGKQASPSILNIEPGIKGEMIWEDGQTLVFKPVKPLVSGQKYSVIVYLSAVYPNEGGTFAFSFEVIKQDYKVEKVNLKPTDFTDLKSNEYEGKVNLIDFAPDELVEQIVSVTQNGKNLPLTWEHVAATNEHVFKAKDVIRTETAGSLTVQWNGKSIGLDKSGSETVDVPALSDFKITQVNVHQSPAQSLQLFFTDPILPSQDLNGLLVLSGAGQVRYSVEMNVVTIYPAKRIDGEVTLQVYPGIKNSIGFAYKNRDSYQLKFETPKPQVEIIGKGTILPDSKGLILPFKTVSVRAVEVQVIKIFENNVASFLQNNDLDGGEQLRRAGRLVVKKIIMLNDNKNLDLTQWNTFSLDLSTLITPDPGAIYRVVLNLKQEFSIYPCEGNKVNNEPIVDEGITDDDIAYWDTPDAYSYSNWDEYEGEYNWEERDNPCHPMYYRDRSVCRNVLASNLGLVAKSGNGKELLVIASDLVTTEPIPNVEIEVYDFQNQLVGHKKSGPDGMVRIDCSRKPYLIIAKHVRNRGYLRVDESSALSLSRFDISGQTVRKGLKGFIYGERGVWRPGDTIFVSFMLEDKQKILPQGHPVVFELQNAMGQLVTRQTSTLSPSGVYTFKASTSESSPTGMWNAKILVGGTVFEKSLRVETVKPNRLKIEMDFGTTLISAGQTPSAQLKCHWLHGAVARNLKAKVSATLSATKTTFKGYDDFVFDDPARHYSAEEVTVFDGQLNDQGVATVKPDLKVSESAPGFLKASFFTRVFEEGGDFSLDRFSVTYSPFASYVGIRTPKGDKRGMLLTDTLHTIEVVTLDATGKGVSRSNLKYYIYKVNWRWWWESGEDDLARYTGAVSESYVTSGMISTINGKGRFNFKIAYPEWGRYLIRVEDAAGGHATGKTVYVDWPGWAMKPAGDNPQDAAMLSFSANKDKYTIGEKATITFPSPSVGRALVSIETGSRVINAYWVATQKGLTTSEFDITPEMAPNIYVHVTLLQPHNQADNNLPIRMYGIIPLLVENPETHLTPVINMPKELQPEKEAVITVSEANGKKMTYTLAIVDDGLLDLTRFKTPEPWNSFYAREALGVKTWDLYDYVMGAYGGKIEQAFSLGGDDELNGKKAGQKANRFKPMVKYMGPFTIEKGKSQTHRIMMPLYVGSVRTMVVACNDGAYGNTEVTTPVRKPVMVLATLPRVLGPGETVKLPVTVFALKEKVGNVTVSVKTSGLVELDGSATQTINFSQAGDQVVNFGLKVGNKTGVAKIVFEAASAIDKATDEIEIEIRNPNPPTAKIVEQTIEAGATAPLKFAFPGIEGTNSAVLEVSSIPPVDFGRRLKYLLSYPHGCVEQTTSAAFPQLFIGDVVEQNDQIKAKTNENVRAGISRLTSMITTDGGFGYWPGATQSDDWGSSYAGHFMLEAEKKGFLLPVNWKKNWVDYQKQQARRWAKAENGYAGYGMLAQAYRLYTLALAGSPEMSAMNRLRNEPALSVNAKWRLAAAYAISGQSSVAQQLIANIGITESTPINEYDYTYGSDSRNNALVIETLTDLGLREKATPLVLELSKQLSSDKWMSTQTTAFSLLAISQFATDKSFSKELKFTLAVNGAKPININQIRPVFQDSLSASGASGQVTITNTSKGILFARVVMEGIPAVGQETASASNLSVSVEYTDMDGKPVDITKLTQGTDFKAIVKVTNAGNLGNYKNLALSQIFPSGWEIRNTRMEQGPSAHDLHIPTYRDYRDDRVYTYFDLNVRNYKKFAVVLNAAYKGTFYLPAVGCEAMYNKSINAYTKGQWVTVE
jgi:uncharacterized protein YfaS (alpha-2-macroglobulin family)